MRAVSLRREDAVPPAAGAAGGGGPTANPGGASSPHGPLQLSLLGCWPVFYIVTGEASKQSAELTGKPIKNRLNGTLVLAKIKPYAGEQEVRHHARVRPHCGEVGKVGGSASVPCASAPGAAL